jgi:hypothetical protein
VTTAKLDAKGHRWLADLATYDFNIKYRPGKSNADADGLSRIPTDTNVRQDINQEFIRTICSSVKLTFQDGVFFFWLLSSLNHFSPVL